jgi:hypothetical protein
MMHIPKSRQIRAGAAGALIAVAAAASAAAFQALPPGSQVNDDPASGIDKTIGVNGESPTNADIVGGALTAGKPAVPWATFRQGTTGSDQIFVRSFAAGKWTTRGNGTVGGRSSGSPFSGSLNFDQGQDGEAPAIDFAGAGRTVPWATWYENTTGGKEFGIGSNNVFASRFDSPSGKWIFAGQGRGKGEGAVPVPSLNIDTGQNAENPSVAGGSATEPSKPGPWVTWQETTATTAALPVEESDQIFVEKPIGPGAANCDTVKPLGVFEGGHIPAIGGFCWQQVGFPRVGEEGADPSLNVDTTRNGVEPDIAFTGPNDSVPWVVWYEKGKSKKEGEPFPSNEMVFAAKGVKDTSPEAEGGFHWAVVGGQLSSVLNTENLCGKSTLNEEKCSLNQNPQQDAENPRVAGGTMNPANATAPWVAWDESVRGVKQIFVARLVHEGKNFELANKGQPISLGVSDSTRPDITFSGNTPYVSWREDVGGGVTKAFSGHFVNAADPTFVLDESDVPLAPTGEGAGQADVREPISSGCIATPFNADGAACQGGAVGTPFFLFTNGTSPLGLFADAYQPNAVVTGGASSIGTSTATVNGAVNPAGAAVNVFFEFGTTTAYGQATAAQRTEPNNSTTPFAAGLAGLATATTIHYRAVAASDFGTFVGADQTLTTASVPPSPPPAPPPSQADGKASVAHATASGETARVRVACTGPTGARCTLLLKLTVTEFLKHDKLISVTARTKLTKKVVVMGSASLTVNAGESRTVNIVLNATGKKLLAKRHKLKGRLRAIQTLANGHATTILSQTLTFQKAKHHR